MAVTSAIKNIVDLPVWDWMRPAPVASVAGSVMATADGVNRYMYYMNLAALYRYDTISDQWTQCASAPVAPLIGSMRYTLYGTYRGKVVSCPANNTLRIAGLSGKRLKGYKIRIMSGTGMGQERTITDVADSVIYDQGVCTTGTANTVGDSLKKWEFNQWVGYQCKLVHSTGLTQYRKILYNDTTTVTLSDTNYQPVDSWNNTGFATAPITTAGSQTHFTIEATDITVNTNWTVNPDSTSRFAILSGSLWLFSSRTTAPFQVLQRYDILSDTWYQHTTIGTLTLAMPTTDNSIERCGEFGGTFDTGTATSATTRTLVNSGKSMEVDRYANFQLRITGGTGIGQRRRIVSNNATTMWVHKDWDTTPDATSTYSIYGDTHKLWVSGGILTSPSILQYNIEEDMWGQGNMDYAGLARNMSVEITGDEPIGVTSGTRGTGGISTIASAPTAGGSGYSIGDILTVSTGGTLGKVMVTGTAAGVVTELKLVACGSGYTTGTGKATTGGTGSSCTVNITAIDVVGKVVTAINHYYKVGDSVKFKGDSLWAGTYTIKGVNSLTEIEFVITAAGNASAASSQGTSTIVDSSANWTANEHVGKIVITALAGQITTASVARRITANTATTLTLQTTITALVNGTGKYLIHDIAAFGRAVQYKGLYPVSTASTLPQNSIGNRGWATSGSTTTLVDSTKKWLPNQWASYKFRIISGTGAGQELTITSNDATTLNFSTATAPDSTSKYEIMDTYGLVTGNVATTTLGDTTKNWQTNMWAGKIVRFTSGTGQGQELLISSNTATVLTFATGTAPVANDTTYCIMDPPARGAGINILWNYGETDTAKKGKYFYMPRGGATVVWDRFNINTGLYDLTFATFPQTETLTTGSMYCYDGKDRIYFTKDATGRVYYIDLTTYSVEAFGQIPTAHGTPALGSRFELIETDDDLHFIYMMQHTGQFLWRTLVW